MNSITIKIPPTKMPPSSLVDDKNSAAPSALGVRVEGEVVGTLVGLNVGTELGEVVGTLVGLCVGTELGDAVVADGELVGRGV